MRVLKPILGFILVASILMNVVYYFRLRNRRAIFTINSEARTKKDMDDYLEQQFAPTYKAMMVQRMLVDQEARKLGVAPTDAEVDDEYTNKKELDWQFANRIAMSPWIADESKNEIRQQLEQQRLLAKDISVTDEEVKEEYSTHPTLYDQPAKAHTEVAVILNDAHTEDIRQLLAKSDPPVSPQVIMQQFPREVVFIGDNYKFTFVQAYGTDMNKEVFLMEPREVKVMQPGDLASQGARRLVVRLMDIMPGKKADLNDPKTLNKIKLNVALRRSKPLPELMSELWANAKFESEDPGDKQLVERMLFPDRARTEAHADVR